MQSFKRIMLWLEKLRDTVYETKCNDDLCRLSYFVFIIEIVKYIDSAYSLKEFNNWYLSKMEYIFRYWNDSHPKGFVNLISLYIPYTITFYAISTVSIALKSYIIHGFKKQMEYCGITKITVVTNCYPENHISTCILEK